MRGTRIAIDTPVLTPSVGVDTPRKPHVRAHVRREDRARRVFEKLRGGGGGLRIRPVRVTHGPERGKAVGGIARRPTAMGRFRVTVHDLLSSDMAGPCYPTAGQHGTSTDPHSLWGRWWHKHSPNSHALHTAQC